jgi:hypothetical protein
MFDLVLSFDSVFGEGILWNVEVFIEQALYSFARGTGESGPVEVVAAIGEANGSQTDAQGTGSGLGRLHLMMRQLSGGGQGHGLVEEASWGWWPFGGESSVQSSRGNRHDTIAGLRRNNASTGLRTRQDTRITAMVSMVREVLPHVPDELIAQVRYGCLVIYPSVNFSYHFKKESFQSGTKNLPALFIFYIGYCS